MKLRLTVRCPVCDGYVALRPDGTIPRHRNTHLGTIFKNPPCEGKGRTPEWEYVQKTLAQARSWAEEYLATCPEMRTETESQCAELFAKQLAKQLADIEARAKAARAHLAAVDKAERKMILAAAARAGLTSPA